MINSNNNSNTTENDLVKKKIAFSRVKRQILGHVWIIRGLIIGSIVVMCLMVGMIGYRALRNSTFGNYIGLGHDFVFPKTEKIKSNEGRVNILLLGKGGAGHDAPDLTDTMIVASVSLANQDIKLISIPRDIWIDSLKAKVNSAYYWGNKKKLGGGLILAKSTIEEMVGIPMHYGVVVDFNVFKEVIDTIEGIEVDVKNGFVDKQFPIPGRENDLCNGDKTHKCRYEIIEFKKGMQTMDGERALKFVRSRHAEGDEGTDTARQARQQQIMMAILKKILTPQILTDVTKIKMLINIGSKNSETDLSNQEISIVGRYVFDARNNMKSSSIPDDLLVNPPLSAKYLNQYVFIPKSGDWKDVQEWVRSILH